MMSHKLSQPYIAISAASGTKAGQQPGSSVLYHSTTTANSCVLLCQYQYGRSIKVEKQVLAHKCRIWYVQ